VIRIFTSPTQKRGELGENAAISYLKQNGFSIIERNVANKFGEIDIVAKKAGIIYCVEVKAGKQGSFINPAENLTKAKLRKFLVSAEYYALVRGIKNYRVVGVLVLFSSDPKTEPKVELLELF
jgi:putative endonuclease